MLSHYYKFKLYYLHFFLISIKTCNEHEGGLFGVMSDGSKMAAPDQKRVLVVD